MQIGAVKIGGKLALAPMAGVTDQAFRAICRAHGAALTVTEMVSTRALSYGDKKTPRLLELGADEHPAAVQIFGHEPQSMAQGAQIALELSACDIIDINMGCPAPKIAGNGDGAALMRDTALAARIIEAVKQAVSVPVTVKFRKGWDEAHVNCVEFARMAEQAGADAVTLHGRTRAQQYSGAADWDAIAAVKQAVRIPVIANGDVFEPEDAVRLLAHTGADMVMIGRGALGDPWLFSRASTLLKTGNLPPLPPLRERLAVAQRQMELAAAQKGERVAMLEARRHINWYLKRESGIKPLKARVCGLERLEQLAPLLAEIAALAEHNSQ